MAVLINGNGNEAIYAAQDADWYASIFGGTTAITGVGNQFAAEVLDANTIGVSDGVIITKEGRRIQLDVDEIDNFDIPNGGQGETNYYIIGYRLVTGGDSSQTAEEFVELMDSSTATINEETFREGADSVYISLYRIKQEGFTLTIQDALLPTVKSVMQLNEDLTDNGETFKFGYDSSTDQMGYYKKVSGADTFFPFSRGYQNITDLFGTAPFNGMNETTYSADLNKYTEFIVQLDGVGTGTRRMIYADTKDTWYQMPAENGYYRSVKFTNSGMITKCNYTASWHDIYVVFAK